MAKKYNDKEQKENNKDIEKFKTIIIVALALVLVFVTSVIVPEYVDMKNKLNSTGDDIIESEYGFKGIGITEYQKLLKNDELTLIYIGRPDCPYSANQNPVLKELMDEHGFVVNYLNINDLDGDDYAVEALFASDTRFTEDGLKTPTIILVEKEDIKLFKTGYTSKENLTILLEENKFIK